ALSFSLPAAATSTIYTLSLHDALPIYRFKGALPVCSKFSGCGRLCQPPSRISTWRRLRRSRKTFSICGGSGAVKVIHWPVRGWRSEEHTSELQSRENLVCRLLLEKTKQ